MIDLHIHTNMSDGSDSPIELLEKISKTDCQIFSVTDHDDLRANNIIRNNMNENFEAKFITGCEISSVFEGRNLHLLCYNFDLDANSIKDMIKKGAALRRQRIVALFDHLDHKHNIIVPSDAREQILARDIPGKVHITDAVMKLGINIDRQDFFANYLDDMESREYKVSAKEVIEAVSEAGGVVSFAHPIEVQREYQISILELEMMVKRLKDIGLVGIEIFHSLHGESQVTAYTKIAAECGLLVSGGSDYHGINKTVKIGELTNYGYTPKDQEISITEVLCKK